MPASFPLPVCLHLAAALLIAGAFALVQGRLLGNLLWHVAWGYL